MPQVSIIVPVYNVEKYLRECLEALRTQTLSDIEIICIDDASTDTSPLLLAEISAIDSRIKVLRHSANRGLSAARNTGTRSATAPWVLFVDSDDLVSSRLCERTLAAAVVTRADVVFFDFAVFNDGQTSPPEPAISKPTHADRRDMLQRPAFAWTKLVRTELLLAKGIEFPEGLCFEDVPVHWRLALDSENPAFLNEALVWYRQRSSSITYRRDWSRADGIKIYDLVADRLRVEGRWKTYGTICMIAEMANFANTHAYYAVANPSLLGKVRTEAQIRMTTEHWELALRGGGLLGWQRDYILGRCRPAAVPAGISCLLASLCVMLRDCLRRVRHRLGR